MIDLKKLSVLAITALLLTGISGITAAAGAKPAPSTASLHNTSLTVLVTSLINSVGDDTFRVTASIEDVEPQKPGRVVRIDGVK